MRNDDLNFKQDELSKGFTSAISVQLPLFSGFKNTKGYQKAELDLHIAKDTQQQVENGIAAEVEIIYNKFQEADQKYMAAEETITMAQEAMRLANLMYEEGASTQLEVLSAQLALTQARMNHVSALYEYQMARYGLRKAAGVLTQVL
jgi:outer membrane protein TolC